jgi:hypothetical protein
MHNSLSWTTDSATCQMKGRRTSVQVNAANGKTGVIISESIAPIASGLLGGLMGELGVGLGV